MTESAPTGSQRQGRHRSRGCSSASTAHPSSTWTSPSASGRALQWIRPESGGAGVPHLVEPKSETSRRTIRLPGFVDDALREHRARWLAERLALGPRWLNEWDLVLVGPIGEPLNPRTVLLQFHAALKRAGLPRIRFHDYADLRVMPTSGPRALGLPLGDGLRALVRSA